MPNQKVIFMVAAAFLLPVSVVLLLNKDALEEHFKVDPSVGKVLYFSAPG